MNFRHFLGIMNSPSTLQIRKIREGVDFRLPILSPGPGKGPPCDRRSLTGTLPGPAVLGPTEPESSFPGTTTGWSGCVSDVRFQVAGS